MTEQALDRSQPGGRRRAEKYDRKRDAVLNAAAKLFCERGYDGSSLNDLADILNVSKPTVYYYFTSKDDILLEIKRRGSDEAIQFLEAIRHEPGSGIEKLRKVLERYAVLMTTYVGRCTADLPLSALPLEGQLEIGARIKRADASIYAILDQAIAEGSVLVEDRLIAYHAIFGSLNWIPRWYRPGGRLSADAVAKAVASILLDGLAVRTAS
jgi:AcrR family transcriptional regulator